LAYEHRSFQQTDWSSCGVFAMVNARADAMNNDNLIRQADIGIARKVFKAELINAKILKSCN